MTRRLYRMSARFPGTTPPPTSPPVPPSRTAGHEWAWAWALEEPDLRRLPALREWLDDAAAEAVTEAGERVDADALPPGGVAYAITGAPWRSWRGPTLVREEPCPACGLALRYAAPPEPGEVAAAALRDVAAALDEAPMCFLVEPMAWVATPGLVAGLAAAGLDSGLRSARLSGGDGGGEDDAGEPGGAVVLWSDAPAGGPLYPFGPEPCAACGRAGAGGVFVRPRYAFELSLRPPATSWSWCSVYGQPHPLVSADVAAWLHAHVPRLRFVRHAGPGDPDAFLAEEYR